MRLAAVVLRYRWPILGLALVGVLASLWTLRNLDANYSFWTLFVSDDPEVVRQRAYVEEWGEDDALLFLALSAEEGRITTFENLGVLTRLHERAEEIEGIEEVVSPLTVTTVRGRGDELVIGPLHEGPITSEADAAQFVREALDNRLIAGTLLAENERTAILALRIEEELRDAADRNPIVIALDELGAELCAGTSLRHHLVGIPVAQYVYSDKMYVDLGVFTGMSILLLATILIVMFRSLTGLLLPLTVVGSATLWTMATLVATGEQINMINTSIPTLMLVIGIADGIHLIAEYRQRIYAGDDVEGAVKHTFKRLGWACLLTSITTAVGFASLAVARIATVRYYGIYAAVGILYAFVANMIIIPIGLYIAKPKAGVEAAENPHTRLNRALRRLALVVTNHPWRTLALSAVVMGIATAGLLRVQVESRMFEEVPDSDPVVVAHRAVERDLPGIISYALDVSTEPGGASDPELLALLYRLSEMAEAHPAVDRAMGLPHLLKEMNRATHPDDPRYDTVPSDPRLIAQFLMLAEGDATERLIDDDHSRTQIWMRGPEVLTSVWEDLRSNLEAEVAALPEQTTIVVTGASAMAQRALGSIIRDVMSSLVGASVIIFIIMSLLMRSVRVGLVSMVPNLVPLLMTVGLMGWLGIHLRTSTVVIFSISLGLAVDDTIHFLVRYQRERSSGLDAVAAISSTFEKTGRPIVYTSVVLAGGFWILILSSFNATRDIGLLGGVTLISALFADLVILPALLKLMPSVGAPRTPTPTP